MRIRLLCTLGLVAAALAATAVPAFTAETQSLNLTVTVQPPPSPCLAFATPPGTNVSFGTARFATVTSRSMPTGDIAPRFRNCGTANEQVTITGSDATSPSTTWRLTEWDESHCATLPLVNAYALWFGVDGGGIYRFVGATTGQQVLAAATPGADHTLELEMVMPCAGSAGAGETFTFSVMLTAAVA